MPREVRPLRDFQSVGFTPDSSTLSLTWPGPGSGVGTSSTRSTSALAPIWSYNAARIPEHLLTHLFVVGPFSPTCN